MKKRIMRICTVMVLTLSLIGVLFARMQGNAKAGTRYVINNEWFKSALKACAAEGKVIREIKVSNQQEGGIAYVLCDDANGNHKIVGMYDNGVFTICPLTTNDQIAFEGNCSKLLSLRAYENEGSAALKELEKVDLRGIDFSEVTSMASFFEGCDDGHSKLNSVKIDLSNASKVTNYSSAFRNCLVLTQLETGVINTSSVTSANSMFAGSGIISFSFANFSINNTKLTTLESFFDGCPYLQSVDMSTVSCVNSTASNIKKNMKNMFRGCTSLSSLTMGKMYWSTNCKVESMFQGCKALTSIDMSAVTLKGVSSLKNMFTDCTALRSINLSHWNTAMVTVFEGLFSGCTSLESVNLKGWKTNNAYSMAMMFNECKSLVSLDLSSFTCENLKLTHPTNSSGVEYTKAGAWWMFNECTNLQYVNLSGFTSASGGSAANFNMEHMFWLCENLEAVNFSNFNPKVDSTVYTTRQGLFGADDADNLCPKLTHVCMTSQSVLNSFFQSAYGHGTTIKTHEYVSGICLGCGTCKNVVEHGEHNMVNGVCTVCNYGGDNNYQMVASVTLKANIALNLAFDLPEDVLNDTGAYVQVSLPNNRTEKLYIKDSVEVLVNKKIWHSVSYELAAKEMADEGTVKIVRGDGTVCKTFNTKVSVKSYGETILNDSSFTAKQKALASALLNYGAYAQKYFKHNTNNLANANCAQNLPSNQAVLNAVSDYALEVYDNGASGVNFEGCSLILADKIKVRFWFSFSTNLTAAQKSGLITAMNLTAGSNNKYYFESTPRTVLYWSYVNQFYGGGYTVRYSVNSYIRDVLTTQPSTNLVNLVKSMYVYWKAAEDYATEN